MNVLHTLLYVLEKGVIYGKCPFARFNSGPIRIFQANVPRVSFYRPKMYRYSKCAVLVGSQRQKSNLRSIFTVSAAPMDFGEIVSIMISTPQLLAFKYCKCPEAVG